MTKRIVWNSQERLDIAHNALKMQKSGFKFNSYTQMVREGQKVLNPTRHRTIAQEQACPDVIELIKKLEKEPPIPEPVVNPPPPPAPPPIAPQVTTKGRVIDVDRLTTNISIFLEDVIVKTAKRVLGNYEVMSAIKRLQDGKLPQMVFHPDESKTVVKKVPTVLVVGLNPPEYAHPQSVMGTRIKLKFHSKISFGLNRLSDIAQHADCAVAVATRSTHKEIDELKLLGIETVKVSDGQSSLIQALQFIAEKYGQ
jgi:hypothetical protein